MLLTNTRAAHDVNNNITDPSANNHDHSLSCVFALSVLPESISVATCGIDTPPRPYTMAVPCRDLQPNNPAQGRQPARDFDILSLPWVTPWVWSSPCRCLQGGTLCRLLLSQTLVFAHVRTTSTNPRRCPRAKWPRVHSLKIKTLKNTRHRPCD